MVKTKSLPENKLGGNVGWVLVMLLVAVSSFLLGASVNQKSGTQTTTDQSPIPTQSVIGDISATLQSPAPAPSPAGQSSPGSDTVATPIISGMVNINTATASELDTLPGIGPAYAKAIIDYRSQFGPYIRIEDIEKVKGIGPKTFEKLKSRITI